MGVILTTIPATIAMNTIGADTATTAATVAVTAITATNATATATTTSIATSFPLRFNS